MSDEVKVPIFFYVDHIKKIPLATMLETDSINTLTQLCTADSDIFNFVFDTLLATKITACTDDLECHSFESLVASNMVLNCANEHCAIHEGILKQIDFISSQTTSPTDIENLLKSNPIISFCLMVKLFI